MTDQILPYSTGSPPHVVFESGYCTFPTYERQLAELKHTQNLLRDLLARDEALLVQKDEQIQQQDILSKESDHRLLNAMQMIASLLAMQSRSVTNVEAAAQLAVAASRISGIERVHRRLHYMDGIPAVAFKQYLDDLCRELTAFLSPHNGVEQHIDVKGVEVMLPSAIGIPLAFVVNELITNAAKYGQGQIAVTLEAATGARYALSVCNDGAALPDGFDPTASKGLGMRIIQSLVARIGGELVISRRDDHQGVKFTVLFPCP